MIKRNRRRPAAVTGVLIRTRDRRRRRGHSPPPTPFTTLRDFLFFFSSPPPSYFSLSLSLRYKIRFSILAVTVRLCTCTYIYIYAFLFFFSAQSACDSRFSRQAAAKAKERGRRTSKSETRSSPRRHQSNCRVIDCRGPIFSPPETPLPASDFDFRFAARRSRLVFRTTDTSSLAAPSCTLVRRSGDIL